MSGNLKFKATKLTIKQASYKHKSLFLYFTMPRIGQARGPYRRIKDEDRYRLIAAHEAGHDFVELAERGVARTLLEDRQTVNDKKCANFTRHMFSYLPRCLAQQDILH